MKRHGLSKHPPSDYNIGDDVFVKYIGKDKSVSRGGTSIKAPKVLNGKVIETNKFLHKYKIRYTTQDNNILEEWFLVDRITSKSASAENDKKRNARQNVRIGVQHPESIKKAFRNLNDIISETAVMAASHKEALGDKMLNLKRKAALENLFIDNSIPADGNCMFHAIANQLTRLSTRSTHTKLRRRIQDFCETILS